MACLQNSLAQFGCLGAQRSPRRFEGGWLRGLGEGSNPEGHLRQRGARVVRRKRKSARGVVAVVVNRQERLNDRRRVSEGVHGFGYVVDLAVAVAGEGHAHHRVDRRRLLATRSLPNHSR